MRTSPPRPSVSRTFSATAKTLAAASPAPSSATAASRARTGQPSIPPTPTIARGLWSNERRPANTLNFLESLWGRKFTSACAGFQRLYSEMKMDDLDPQGFGALFLQPYQEAMQGFRKLYVAFQLCGDHPSHPKFAGTAHQIETFQSMMPRYELTPTNLAQFDFADPGPDLAPLFAMDFEAASQAFEVLYLKNLRWTFQEENLAIARSELTSCVWDKAHRRLEILEIPVECDPIPSLRRKPQPETWFQEFSTLDFPQAKALFEKKWRSRHEAPITDFLEYTPQCEYSDLRHEPRLADINADTIGRIFLLSDAGALESFERLYFIFRLQNSRSDSARNLIAAQMGLTYPQFHRAMTRFAMKSKEIQAWKLECQPSDLRPLFALPHRTALLEFRRLYFRVLLQAFAGNVPELAKRCGMSPIKVALALKRFDIVYDPDEGLLIPNLRKNPPSPEVVEARIALSDEAPSLDYELADLFALPWETALEEFYRLHCRALLSDIDPQGLGAVFLLDHAAAMKTFQRLHSISRWDGDFAGPKLFHAARLLGVPQSEALKLHHQVKHYRSAAVDSDFGQLLARPYNDAVEGFERLYFRLLWEKFHGDLQAMAFWTKLEPKILPQLLPDPNKTEAPDNGKVRIDELLRADVPHRHSPRISNVGNVDQYAEAFKTLHHQLSDFSIA